MNQPQLTQSIVVGIDGSHAAINAAKWASAEARSQGLPLRLVHVIEEDAASASATDPDLGMEYTETVLSEADAALQADKEPVKVETAMVRGSPGESLIAESHDAAMVCVGSIGVGCCTSMLFGSTGTALARGAHCPVAIIRTHRDTAAPACGWIAVAVDDLPGNDILLEYAFREAQLRNAPILALEARPWQRARLLDERLECWASRYPNVRIRLTLIQRRLTEFLANTDEPVQLAVIGKTDANRITHIMGPVTHGIPDQAGCSVLVVGD